MSGQQDDSPKAWSGRFSQPVAELVKRYTASVEFDQRLAEFDIEGSLAHARMLAKQAIISQADLAAIERVRDEAEPGRRYADELHDLLLSLMVRIITSSKFGFHAW